MFYDLLGQIRDDIIQNEITRLQQLLIELHFLASGSFQQVIANMIKVNKSTVCRTITSVTNALLNLQNLFIYWPSEQECAQTSSIIYQSTKFPCVEGFVDGTHVRITKPHIHEQVYVNRKDFRSINVQICGNGDMTIIYVVAKWPGSVIDARILLNSSLYEKFTEQVLPYLPNGIILGDSGYPLP
jgi:hypothetical protein